MLLYLSLLPSVLLSFLPSDMQTSITKQFWGYKKMSEHMISFYHVCVPDIPDQVIVDCVSGISYIQREKDGSVMLHIEPGYTIDSVLKSLLQLCVKQSDAFCETPNSYYKIPFQMRQSFLTWALAFKGCLAMLLLSDKALSPFFQGNWEYINAKTGGLYLSPFTIFLYSDHPKIVHPVTLKNTNDRLLIEQKTAHYIKLIFKRVSEAQSGMEGMALLSVVEEKTDLPTTAITKEINTKSFQVKVPIYSSFFSDL